jgi:hypothetical protein
VGDFRHTRKGVPHLKVSGKGGKTRYLPLHPGTNGLINDYLEAVGHGTDDNGALFRSVSNNRAGKAERAITADGVYKLVRAFRRNSGSRSARTRCARPPPPTRSITRPTSPRCRNGSATPISPQRASTITAAPVRRTARRSRSRTDGGVENVVCDIREGGESAFQVRARRLRVSSLREPTLRRPAGVDPKPTVRRALSIAPWTHSRAQMIMASRGRGSDNGRRELAADPRT